MFSNIRQKLMSWCITPYNVETNDSNTERC